MTKTKETLEARAIALLAADAHAGWAVAERLAKEKLVRERRYLPQFVYADGRVQ
jgi:hypothetical protein